MTDNELDILKELAIGRSPCTKLPKIENFYLTSKEGLPYLMCFIDALAWATRNGHLTSSLRTDPQDFEDPEETPEERAKFYQNRYKRLSPEERAELEAFDRTISN